MTKNDYLIRTDEYILPFLKKNGYMLIKSEFVLEQNIWYLRLYIDLTEDEIRRRTEELLTQDALDEITDIQDSDMVRSLISEEKSADDANDDDGEAFTPGIDVNDCARVSRYLSKWLDKEDFIKEAYTLEVCSKGFLDNSNTTGV